MYILGPMPQNSPSVMEVMDKTLLFVEKELEIHQSEFLHSSDCLEDVLLLSLFLYDCYKMFTL